eukprot:scaffold88141_cov49-Phaeocystis_antarctica.AAC.2
MQITNRTTIRRSRHVQVSPWRAALALLAHQVLSAALHQPAAGHLRHFPGQRPLLGVVPVAVCVICDRARGAHVPRSGAAAPRHPVQPLPQASERRGAESCM